MVLTEEEQERIRKAAEEKTPEDSGVTGKLWTLGRTRQYIILDNLKVDHGKTVAAWLEKHKDKIQVFFLPPRASEYNPDEYLNHALKISVHSGQLSYTTDDIPHKILSFMWKLQHQPLLVPSFFHHPALSCL